MLLLVLQTSWARYTIAAKVLEDNLKQSGLGFKPKVLWLRIRTYCLFIYIIYIYIYHFSASSFYLLQSLIRLRIARLCARSTFQKTLASINAPAPSDSARSIGNTSPGLSQAQASDSSISTTRCNMQLD